MSVSATLIIVSFGFELNEITNTDRKVLGFGNFMRH